MTLEHFSKALRTNLAGLNALADDVDGMAGDIEAALDLIENMKGRLIVTGLGKSGHVGAKLAATFTSTGTPAYFLHPAEASHGDLGMVQAEDVILALSWSGETAELSDVLAYAKRRRVPLVALTSDASGTLARAASVALVLPKVREACPHNLAPTTSALLQLAAGDALAVALLQRKGFGPDSFHAFHPGGSLGSALRRVEEIMHEADKLPLVESGAPVVSAINELSARGFGIVGITEGERLLGVITDGDVRRYLEKMAGTTMQEALHDAQADAVMTVESVTLSPDTIAGEALSVLQERRISAAFVLDDEERPLGLITMLRLLNRGTA